MSTCGSPKINKQADYLFSCKVMLNMPKSDIDFPIVIQLDNGI